MIKEILWTIHCYLACFKISKYVGNLIINSVEPLYIDRLMNELKDAKPGQLINLNPIEYRLHQRFINIRELDRDEI